MKKKLLLKNSPNNSVGGIFLVAVAVVSKSFGLALVIDSPTIFAWLTHFN